MLVTQSSVGHQFSLPRDRDTWPVTLPVSLREVPSPGRWARRDCQPAKSILVKFLPWLPISTPLFWVLKAEKLVLGSRRYFAKSAYVGWPWELHLFNFVISVNTSVFNDTIILVYVCICVHKHTQALWIVYMLSPLLLKCIQFFLFCLINIQLGYSCGFSDMF